MRPLVETDWLLKNLDKVKIFDLHCICRTPIEMRKRNLMKNIYTDQFF